MEAPLIDGSPNEFTKGPDEPQDHGMVTTLDIEYVPCISDFIVRWFFIWIFWCSWWGFWLHIGGGQRKFFYHSFRAINQG